MTYAQIIIAHAALQEFGKNRLPFAEARKVFGITKAVKNEYEFYCAEEKKLVQAYASLREDGGYVNSEGLLHFDTSDAAAEFLNAREALMAAECEITPITIPASVMERIDISPEMLAQLDGVISFGEEVEPDNARN